MQHDEKNNQDLQCLAEKIMATQKPVLFVNTKKVIKNRILSQIKDPSFETVPYSLESVVQYIREMVLQINLSHIRKSELREKIFATVEVSPQRSFFWSNFFAFNKKLASVVAVFTILFGVFAFAKVEPRITQAKTLTYLEYFTGEVSVVRDGKNIIPYVNMEIKEGDRIVTGEKSLAVVKYFDDSVSRLSNNTDLQVNRLYKPGTDYIASNVEVSLLEGKVWSKVINLVDDKSDFSVKVNDVYAKAKKAAFNVEVDSEKKAEIQVFNRTVKLYKNDSAVASISIHNGQKAVIASEEAVSVQTIGDTEKNQPWVETNLKDDQAYVAAAETEMLKKGAESLGINDQADASLNSSLGEKAALLLAFDGLTKKQMELDLADKNFISAQLKLMNPAITEDERLQAEAALNDFAAKVREFYKFTDDIAKTDADYANELRKNLDEKLLLYKKDLSVILLDSPLYEAKKIIDDLNLLQAKDETELQKMKEDNALNKMEEIEDVAVTKDQSTDQLSQQVIDQYKENLDAAVKLMESMQSENPEEAKRLTTQFENYVKFLADTNRITANEEDQLKQKFEQLAGTDDTVAQENGVVTTTVEVVAPAGTALAVPVDDTADRVKEPAETIYGGVRVQDGRPLPPGL